MKDKYPTKLTKLVASEARWNKMKRASYTSELENVWSEARELLIQVTGEKNPFTEKLLANALAVRILLDLGYDPSVEDNIAMKRACNNCYLDTVTLLSERAN